MSSKITKTILAIIFIVILTSNVIADDICAARSNSVSSSDSSGSSNSSDSSSSSNSGSRSTSSTTTSSSSNSGSTHSGSRTTREDSISEDEDQEDKEETEQEENKAQDTSYVKERLKISEEAKLKEKTIQRLTIRKSLDNKNFEKIVRLIRRITEDDADKEILVDEIVDMDKYFIEKLSDRLENSSEIKRVRIKKQVENYIQTVKYKKPVKVEVKEDKIKDLFDKKTDIDSLMNDIWNS